MSTPKKKLKGITFGDGCRARNRLPGPIPKRRSENRRCPTCDQIQRQNEFGYLDCVFEHVAGGVGVRFYSK